MSVARIVVSFLQAHLSAVCFPLQKFFATLELMVLDAWWTLNGYRKPSKDDASLVADNVTFIFKSFERQWQASALFSSINKYYPGTRVVIADDSSKPLDLKGDNLKIIQMPFNSGLSKGLNMALAEVQTPYLVRMDDDELLTRHMNLADEIHFLQSHPDVDIVGMPRKDALKFRSMNRSNSPYFKSTMNEAPLPLKIPHGTMTDDSHVVLGKVTNSFLARTESIKKLGWDDNIRMIDHHDFFFRAAGVLVSVLSLKAVVFHNHNFFSPYYNHYRNDWKDDLLYIRRTRYGMRKDLELRQNEEEG